VTEGPTARDAGSGSPAVRPWRRAPRRTGVTRAWAAAKSTNSAARGSLAGAPRPPCRSRFRRPFTVDGAFGDGRVGAWKGGTRHAIVPGHGARA